MTKCALLALLIAVGCGRSDVTTLQATNSEQPGIAGHWLRIEYADTYTAEDWWSFGADGRFLQTIRRVSAIGDDRITTTTGEGTYEVDANGVITIDWIDVYATKTRMTFTGAIVGTSQFSPDLDVPPYLPDSERLAPAGRRLTTRAYVSAGDNRFRGESTLELHRADGSTVHLSTIAELDVKDSLNGGVCQAQLMLSASDGDRRDEELLTRACTLTLDSSTNIATLAFDAEQSALPQAFTPVLRFDPSKPEVLIGDDDYAWRHAMAVEPPPPDEAPSSH